MFTRHAHEPSSRTMFMCRVHELIYNSDFFANYRVELYYAQVQLIYKTNLKIMLKIDSFMNRTELEPSFFRTEHQAIIERINSFTTLANILISPMPSDAALVTQFSLITSKMIYTTCSVG